MTWVIYIVRKYAWLEVDVIDHALYLVDWANPQWGCCTCVSFVSYSMIQWSRVSSFIIIKYVILASIVIALAFLFIYFCIFINLNYSIFNNCTLQKDQAKLPTIQKNVSTALVQAADNGHYQITRELASSGFVDLVSAPGTTPPITPTVVTVVEVHRSFVFGVKKRILSESHTVEPCAGE